jgi:hypothetical protein
MGLFSRFQPGIYSPTLAQMGQPEPLQGPRELPAMQAQAAPTMPKKQGLFGGWKAPDENGISKWDRVGLLGASLRDDPSVAPAMMQALQGQSELAMKRQSAQAKSQQQAQLLAMADKLGMDDREKVLFLSNPNEWAKANASRFEAATLSQGQRRYAPDGSIIAAAPDYQTMGDQLVQIDPSGAQGIFRRDPTVSEQETAEEHDWRRRFDTQGFDWQRQYQAGQLGVQRGNLGMRQKEYEARKAAGGFGTPGAGQILGPTLPGNPSDWE